MTSTTLHRLQRSFRLSLLAVACVATAKSASAQTVPDYTTIDPYMGGDCGATDLPVCRVRRPWSADTLRARTSAGPAVWRSASDEVTFAYDGAATSVGACCSVQMPLSPLRGTSLWVLSVRVPDADRLAMSVAFIVQDTTAGTYNWIESGRWAGPLAAPAPRRAEVLAGTLATDSLRSAALGSTRAVTVYLPPAWGDGPHRVVYLFDGQRTEDYARVLEPAILDGRVPPVALVGVHSATDRTPGNSLDGRGREYLAGRDSARYAAHETFFLTDVVPWAEAQIGLSAEPADRVVFGVSNGASFAAAMVRRHPERFAAALAFSHAYDGLDAADDPDLSGRRFFLLAGRLEPGFVPIARAVAGAVAARGASVHQEVGVSGHDAVMWHGTFARAVAWAFDDPE